MLRRRGASLTNQHPSTSSYPTHASSSTTSQHAKLKQPAAKPTAALAAKNSSKKSVNSSETHAEQQSQTDHPSSKNNNKHNNNNNRHIHQASVSSVSSYESCEDIMEDLEEPTRSKSTDSCKSTSFDRIRSWVRDALSLRIYHTAVFWADKLVSMNNFDSHDVELLAQALFFSGHFTRCHSLLVTKGTRNQFCRSLSAECLIKLDKFDEAIQFLEDSHDWNNSDSSNVTSFSTWGQRISIEASQLHQLGVCHSKMKDVESAKKAYQAALLADVRCYDSYHSLVNGHLLTPHQEREMLESLDFDKCGEEAELVRLLYTIQLKKYGHFSELESNIQILEDKYRLKGNVLILLCKAEIYHAVCNYEKSLAETEQILSSDPLNHDCLWTHVTNLYQLKRINSLFILGHDLVDRYPSYAVSWFCVGTYYLAIQNSSEARRFFGKATRIDPGCAPAWIGFGHAMVMEGSGEQAITAYSVAAKQYKGTHLPTLFIGMQHIQSGNIKLGSEYIKSASSICSDDSLLINELGVLAYHQDDYVAAIDHFLTALEHVKHNYTLPHEWEITWCNLGHAYRKNKQYEEAKAAFEHCICLNPRNSLALSSLALVYHMCGQTDEAILKLHESLSIHPEDAIAKDLLKVCLDASLMKPFCISTMVDDMNAQYDTDTLIFPPWMEEQQQQQKEASEDIYLTTESSLSSSSSSNQPAVILIDPKGKSKLLPPNTQTFAHPSSHQRDSRISKAKQGPAMLQSHYKTYESDESGNESQSSHDMMGTPLHPTGLLFFGKGGSHPVSTDDEMTTQVPAREVHTNDSEAVDGPGSITLATTGHSSFVTPDAGGRAVSGRGRGRGRGRVTGTGAGSGVSVTATTTTTAIANSTVTVEADGTGGRTRMTRSRALVTPDQGGVVEMPAVRRGARIMDMTPVVSPGRRRGRRGGMSESTAVDLGVLSGTEDVDPRGSVYRAGGRSRETGSTGGGSTVSRMRTRRDRTVTFRESEDDAGHDIEEHDDDDVDMELD